MSPWILKVPYSQGRISKVQGFLPECQSRDEPAGHVVGHLCWYLFQKEWLMGMGLGFFFFFNQTYIFTGTFWDGAVCRSQWVGASSCLQGCHHPWEIRQASGVVDGTFAPISLLLLVRWFPSRTMWQVWPCGLLRPVECGQTRVSQLEAWPCVPLPHQFCSAVLWKNHVPGSLLVQEAWWMQGTDLEACWSLESSPNTPDLS